MTTRPQTTPKASATVPTRRLRGILSLEDLEDAARRTLPKSIFSFISGGVERDSSQKANEASFQELSLCPRVLIDTSERGTTVKLFDTSYRAPFGIAPMGAAGLAGYRADMALARAAAAAQIPFILSGSSLIPLERIAMENPDAWFQAYLSTDRAATEGLLNRLAAAGYRTLVVTADVPVPGNRENLIRSGYTSPLRPTPRLAWDGLTHPRWLLKTALQTLLKDGLPHFENFGATRGAPVISTKAMRSHVRDALCWRDIEWLRALWKGRLVIKGVLAPSDARTARDVGADGIIVSNHGGRQLDGAVAPLRMLPDIAAVAGELTILYDSGIRRGTDAIKALALGADFVFVGRPFLYAAAIAGEAGVAHAIDILRQEVHRNLALLGCTDLTELDSRVIGPFPNVRASRESELGF